MKGIFDHIAQSDQTDPIRFFRNIVDSQKVNEAILRFMPLKIDLDTTNYIFEPVGEYRNVDYGNVTFERKERDIDYRPEKREDPDEIYFWNHFSFKNNLAVTLELEVIKSKSFLDAYFLNHSNSIATRVQYLNLEINNLKNLLVRDSQNRFTIIIAHALDELNVYINGKGLKEEVQTRITREGLSKIFDALTDNLELDVDRNDFVEWFFTFNSKKLPTKEISIRIKNVKSIYYLISKINAISPFNYQRLSELRLLSINSKFFDAGNMDTYPYTFAKTKRPLIDSHLALE